jgi:hypothetical protein
VVERGEVDFVAYGEDFILSGRTVLDGDRLTDMLNRHVNTTSSASRSGASMAAATSNPRAGGLARRALARPRHPGARQRRAST